VPLTRPWFRGMVSVRGNLFAVTDLAAFAGEAPVALTAQTKLLLVGQPHGGNAALLVSRVLGLRKLADFAAEEEAAGGASWRSGLYRDAAGMRWRELDVASLLRAPELLQIAA